MNTVQPRRSLIPALGVCAILFLAGAVGLDRLQAEAPEWDRSIVRLDIVYKRHDAFQPWIEPTRTISKCGVVLDGNEILTTAYGFPSATMVRLQKGGRGRWYPARVLWWDAQSDLALVTTDEAGFWEGLQPASLAERIPIVPGFEFIRWQDGQLEKRRADFSQFKVDTTTTGVASFVRLGIDLNLSGKGWSEILAHEGEVVGLTDDGGGESIPSTVIRQTLDAYHKGTFTGAGVFDFTWSRGGNPELMRELGQTGPSRGVIIGRSGKEDDATKAPQVRDIVLEIDGFDIDSDGYYRDPDFGPLNLEYLANRGHQAGDTIPITVLREGERQELAYTLPAARFEDSLVPGKSYGEVPRYVIQGGLIFQPLTEAFLRGWGEDWRKRAPFRLQYYPYQKETIGRESLVILTGVMPDPINLGYQDDSLMVVDKVNGQGVSTLTELLKAFDEPSEGGVHVIEFMPGSDTQRILLDASELEAATQRVLWNFSVPAPYRL